MKIYWIISLFILLQLGFASNVNAHELPFWLGQSEEFANNPNFQGEFSYTIIDEAKKVDPLSLIDQPMHRLNSPVPNFGFETRDVWLRAHIDAVDYRMKESVLVFSNCNLDLVEVYYFDRGKNLLFHGKYSDLLDFNVRSIDSRKAAFILPIKPFKNHTLLIRMNNGGEQFHTDINFMSKNEFHQEENSESYFLGIFMGLLFFSILVNIYMFVLTKDELSKYYSFYLIALFLLQASLLGFGKMYLWQNSAYWSNHANPIFASVSVYFLLSFARLYLNLKTKAKGLDKVFKWVGYLVFINIVLSLIPASFAYKNSIVVINVITLLLNLFILPTAIIIYRRGNKQALLFFVAFLLLVVSVFGFVLKNFGVLPANFFTNFGFQIGSGIEVLLFSLGIIIRFRNVQRDAIGRLEEINNLKEKANEELEQKVVERTLEINLQKAEIEDKNKEIVDSINYAKRIQLAILPPNQKAKQIVPTIEIFYQPKDIVSGDFYWIEEKTIDQKTYSFIAVADCTGHGVPGAMMSVLCNSVLNRVLEATKEVNPGQFLQQVDELLKVELSKSEEAIRDGMDLGLVILDTQNSTLHFAGANIPLWILSKGQLMELDSVHRAIGFGGNEKPFETHSYILQQGEMCFLFSDGLVDQFSEKDGKKIKKKLLREWISNNQQLKRDELCQVLAANFNRWKGNEEQTDDVTLLLL